MRDFYIEAQVITRGVCPGISSFTNGAFDLKLGFSHEQLGYFSYEQLLPGIFRNIFS